MVSLYSAFPTILLITAFASLLHSAGEPARELNREEQAQLMKQLAGATGAGARTMKFKEVRRSPLLAKPVETSGALFFAPPDSFRREIQKPTPSTAISDGESLWMIYPDFHEVEVYSLDNLSSAGAGLGILRAIFFPGELTRHFQVRAWAVPQGHQLELRPRRAMRREITRFVLQLRSDHTIRACEIEMRDGSTNSLQFEPSESFNPPPDFFQFVPDESMNVSRPLG